MQIASEKQTVLWLVGCRSEVAIDVSTLKYLRDRASSNAAAVSVNALQRAPEFRLAGSVDDSAFAAC